MNRIILYDGYCNLCVFVVKWILKRQQSKEIFRFEAIQNQNARALLKERNISFISLNTIYYIEDKKVFIKSKAVIEILKQLPSQKFLVNFLNIFPTSIADNGYNIISKLRYYIFGKRKDLFIVTKYPKI